MDGTHVKYMPLPVLLVPKADISGLGCSFIIFLISVILAGPTD